jgi:hypothetical protein
MFRLEDYCMFQDRPTQPRLWTPQTMNLRVIMAIDQETLALPVRSAVLKLVAGGQILAVGT